jgi:hypothetical protein
VEPNKKLQVLSIGDWERCSPVTAMRRCTHHSTSQLHFRQVLIHGKNCYYVRKVVAPHITPDFHARSRPLKEAAVESEHLMKFLSHSNPICGVGYVFRVGSFEPSLDPRLC